MTDAEVAVIGAGIGGIATALCLRRSGLAVTLVEARDDVCLGSTLVPGRLHYGGMYFKEYLATGHAHSAVACLHAADAFHRMFSGDMWGEDLGTVYIVASDAHVRDAQRQLVTFHEIIADECRRLDAGSRFKGRLPFRSLDTERDFYTKISAGVRTVEPGISTAKLAVGLRRCLAQEGVTVAFDQEVARVERRNGSYVLYCRSRGGFESQIESRVVVQCAGARGPALDAQMGIAQTSGVELKGATILALTDESVRVPTTYLVAGGSFNFHRRGGAQLPSNGMIVSGGKDAKDVDDIVLSHDTGWELPPSWSHWLDGRVPPSDWQDRAFRSIEIGAANIPSLNGARPEAFVVRATVRHDETTQSRRHVNVYAEDQGYLATTCVKLSSAPQLALDVVRRVRLYLGVDRSGTSVGPSAFRFELELDRTDALEFARTSGLTPNLVPPPVERERWPPWTNVPL